MDENKEPVGTEEVDEEEGKTQKKRFNILNPFGGYYRRVKADTEWSRRTMFFGLISIAFSAACMVLSYFCVEWGCKAVVWSVTTHLGFGTTFLLLGNIFAFFASLAIFLIPYYLWIYSVALVIMQLMLNRRFIGLIAAVIWIASLFGIVWASYTAFVHVTGINFFGIPLLEFLAAPMRL